jgi:di/tricarboxylate transporter
VYPGTLIGPAGRNRAIARRPAAAPTVAGPNVPVSSATVSLLVLAASVALFVWNRLPVGIVAIATALALYFTGVLDVSTALSGFGDPVVIFIATLFVVSEGLEASGVTAWAGQVLTQRAGTKRSRLLIAVMALSAVLSAFITPNGAAAALLPVTVVVARRASLLPSKMLIPLAFAASAVRYSR